MWGVKIYNFVLIFTDKWCSICRACFIATYFSSFRNNAFHKLITNKFVNSSIVKYYTALQNIGVRFPSGSLTTIHYQSIINNYKFDLRTFYGPRVGSAYLCDPTQIYLKFGGPWCQVKLNGLRRSVHMLIISWVIRISGRTSVQRFDVVAPPSRMIADNRLG